MKRLLQFALLSLYCTCVFHSHGAPTAGERAERSPLSTFFVAPSRVLWQTEKGVQNSGSLLKPHAGQPVLKEPQPPCVLTAASNAPAGLLLDFGRELQGYVELITPMTAEQAKLRRVRVRFGGMERPSFCAS